MSPLEVAVSESPTPPPAGAKPRNTARRARRAPRTAAPDAAQPPPGVGTRLWSGLKLLVGVSVARGIALAAVWGGVRYATTTKAFAIRELVVTGSKRKTDAEVAKLGGIGVGQNVFALDTREAERRILDDPWVREVTVRRKLPGTVEVELLERDAVCVAAIGDQLYLVTREGEPFKQVEPGDPYDLPMLTGISAENLASDRPREIERVAVGTEVLKSWERLPMSRVHVAQEVHLELDGTVVLTVGKQGISLELGHGPWRKKLLMASEVIARLQVKAQRPGIVFLDNQAHPERVVVRMR